MRDADDQQLRRAAARAAADPFFVAFALAAYRALAGLDESELAAWLGCPEQNMARLALCRRPDGGSVMFGDEVRRIAGYAGSDAGRLAQILRAVENAEAMRSAPPGALMAAHDRRPVADAQPPPPPATPDLGAGGPEEHPEGSP